MDYPDQKKLQELFDYIDGKLIRKKTIGVSKAGSAVGRIGNRSYLVTDIGKKRCLVHRIVFMWHYGWLPEMIDHINGNRTDNRIENMRPATKLQNNANASIRRDNTTGFKGVSINKGKYVANIRIGGKKVSLGSFETALEADAAVRVRREEIHGEYARHK